jgi:succinyl-CoA synthetase beta subunit/citryl-CoA synthetase large subunit
MRLLEHQAKKLLAAFGLNLTQPVLAGSPEEAVAAMKRLGKAAVMKAQVPFGHRGKAGGVRFVETSADAWRAASELLGMNLRGVKVAQVSVEEKLISSRELYAGMAWDTQAKRPVALIGIAGGMDVEQSASEQIARRPFDPWIGFPAHMGRELAVRVGLKGKALIGMGELLQKLAHAFVTCDAITMEINPVAETMEGALVGLDARVEIEDDAMFRQQERMAALGELMLTATGRSPTPLEREAQRIDAMDHRGVAGRVVEFEGNLALLIGGGGASLTVFDAIQRYGGKPANYCEVGGNPTEEKVAALTQLLISRPGIQKIAVIMNVVNNTRADVMARGVLMGLENSGRKPSETISVFRVPGSWEQEARELLAISGVQALGREVSLDAAARLAVKGVANHDS